MREEHYIKLKKTREEKGLTQAEVATYLGVSRQAISQWERGLAYPDIGNLMSLCQLYQISINDLLPLNENLEIKNQTEEELKEAKEPDLHSALEFLSILIILALSSQVALLGMIVPIIVICWARKNPKM